MATYTVGQVVKVHHEGTVSLGIVTAVRADGDVDVDVMVPVNVLHLTVNAASEATIAP